MTEQITSRENGLIKDALKVASSAKYRRAHRKFFIEGLRLSLDAVKSGTEVLQFFYTADALKKWPQEFKILNQSAKKRCMISGPLANLLTDTKTPQGFFCICAMKNDSDRAIFSAAKKIIALENIQDPTNLGTILRTAEALGIDAIVFSENCCDFYSPKVLRGSMGAVFRIPFFKFSNLPGAIENLRGEGFRAFASVVTKDAKFINDVSLGGRVVVAIGNEGNGLTDALIRACSEKITIPMNGRAESLNASAAANIIMWEMMRERVEEDGE